jgi:long-subunit fatty acid transport protein
MGPIVTNATNSVGGSKLVDLPLDLYFKDAYLPQKVSLGVGWRIIDDLLWTVDGVWYNWGGFDEEMSKDDLVRDNIDFDFVDTYVPKTGLEYQVVENLFLRFGYSYQTSPLRKPGSNGSYLLDNDKHVGGLGIGYDLELGILNYPISLDAAFTHHYLAPRDLESSDGTKLESKGNLSGGTASVTIRF